MLEEAIVRHCSPTLAGLKTGCLFRFPAPSPSALQQELRLLNRVLGQKGVRILPLKREPQQVLIYCFRPELLRRDLARRDALPLLRERAYPCGCPERCVVQLIRRLKTEREFPHEIGLFLGYPPEDVIGFLEHRAGDYKSAGCWKVYGNERTAHRLFRIYKACTASYLRHFQAGLPLEQLTVTTTGEGGIS